MKKTAILALAAIFLFAPFQGVQAAPPTDYETQIVSIKSQIKLLEMQLAKIKMDQKTLEKQLKKEKKITNKKIKRMTDQNTTAGSSLPEAVIELDAKWAEREVELDAKYKIPGKWKQVDDKGMREFKKYQDKREQLLSA